MKQRIVLMFMVVALALAIFLIANAEFKGQRINTDGTTMALYHTWTSVGADTGTTGKLGIHKTFYSDTIDLNTFGAFSLLDIACHLYQIDTGNYAGDTVNDSMRVSLMMRMPGSYEKALYCDSIYKIDTVVHIAIPYDSCFRYMYIKTVYADTMDMTGKLATSSTMKYHWWYEIEVK